MRLLDRFRAWRRARQLRRRWPTWLQLENLRIQVEQDARWMAHDPKVAALCQRYADMLAADWYARPVRGVSDFRREIGAEPKY